MIRPLELSPVDVECFAAGWPSADIGAGSQVRTLPTLELPTCEQQSVSAVRDVDVVTVVGRQRRGLEQGWVIAKRESISGQDRDSIRCLQLATGQWCPPDQATWFPLSRSAILYARDLGHEIGGSVEIIHLTRLPL